MAKLFGVVVLVALFASKAGAVPLVVSAGDFVTFNFDLSGATPPPPYEIASMNVNLEGLDFAPPPCTGPNDECDPLDIGEWQFWTELNGTGSNFFTFAGANLNAAFLEGMKDGVFSATLQMFEGAITVDPVACGITGDGARTPACPAAPPPPAPEPATVALLAAGAVVVMARRRKASAAK